MAVLVAYDGSEPAQKAVEHAIEEHADKQLILLGVVEVASSATSAGINLAQEKLKELRDETREGISADLQQRLDEENIDYEIETVFGQPAREIVEYAEENDIGHILIGNHGRSGVSRVLLGSVAEKVVRRAPMPVTVVR